MGTWEAQRRGGFLRAVCLAALLSTFPAAWAAPATAEPASGPREDIDQSFTTRSPGAATGVDFTARYHAAGDPNGEPPYMRKMIFHPPGGMRYDTSVPGQCTASDPQLQLMGPAACPADSKLGSGTVDGIFKVPFSEDLVFDRYHHPVHVFNNARADPADRVRGLHGRSREDP